MRRNNQGQGELTDARQASASPHNSIHFDIVCQMQFAHSSRKQSMCVTEEEAFEMIRATEELEIRTAQ